MGKKDFFVFGINPVAELIASDKPVDKVLVQRGKSTPEVQSILTEAREKNIPIQKVPVEKLQGLCNQYKTGQKIVHQGVIAFASLINYIALEDVINWSFDQGNQPLIILLDGVKDVRNLGAIARSAQAFGVDALVIPETGSAQINPFAMKSSAGALSKLRVCRVPDVFSAIRILKDHGVQVVGTSLKASQTLGNSDFNQPLGIIMGSEETGLSRNVESECDTLVKIEMSGEMESLNVSVSAGVMLYEINRQRQA